MAAEAVPPGAGPIVDALHAAAHVAPRSAARLGLWVAEAAIRVARMYPGRRSPRWVADVDLTYVAMPVMGIGLLAILMPLTMPKPGDYRWTHKHTR